MTSRAEHNCYDHPAACRIQRDTARALLWGSRVPVGLTAEELEDAERPAYFVVTYCATCGLGASVSVDSWETPYGAEPLLRDTQALIAECESWKRAGLSDELIVALADPMPDDEAYSGG